MDFQPTYERLQKTNGLSLTNQIAEAKKELLAIAEPRPKRVTSGMGVAGVEPATSSL